MSIVLITPRVEYAAETDYPGRRILQLFFQFLLVRTRRLAAFFSRKRISLEFDRTVVLSNQLWQRRFGSNNAVIGKRITLDDESYTVVGVMPDSFRFPHQVIELWTAVGWCEQRKKRTSAPAQKFTPT